MCLSLVLFCCLSVPESLLVHINCRDLGTFTNVGIVIKLTFCTMSNNRKYTQEKPMISILNQLSLTKEGFVHLSKFKGIHIQRVAFFKQMHNMLFSFFHLTLYHEH